MLRIRSFLANPADRLPSSCIPPKRYTFLFSRAFARRIHFLWYPSSLAEPEKGGHSTFRGGETSRKKNPPPAVKSRMSLFFSLTPFLLSLYRSATRVGGEKLFQLFCAIREKVA
jgi:hypothetical protein